MEVCSFPLKPPKTVTSDRFSSLSCIPNFSLSPKTSKGFQLLIKPARLRRLSVVAAVLGDKNSVPSDCSSGDELSVSEAGGNSENGEGEGGVGSLDDHKMTRICDKLIEVFMVDKPATTDCRRLLAFSREWDDIRPHFFKRCQDRADVEDDPGMKHKILWLGRKLKEVDKDVQRHNELLKVVRGAPSDISDIVAGRRIDFTEEFFVHLQTVSESYYENLEEQKALARIGNACLAAVQAYDSATENIEALNVADLKFQDIIGSPSVDTACRRIDNLAEKYQLDSTFRSSHSENPSAPNTVADLSSPQNADAEFSETQSLNQSLRPYLLALWLRSCPSLEDVSRVHALILRCISNPVTYVFNNLMSAYLGFGKLVLARKVFDGMNVRNVVSWTAIVNGYLNFGLDDEALGLFCEAVDEGIQPNGNMCVCMLNLCCKRLDFELGRQIHGGIVKGGWSNMIVDSAIVKLYAQCGELSSAFRAFDQMTKLDVVCWTTMITACSQQGKGEEAFSLFSQMLSDGFFPNEFTVCGVLKACGEEKQLRFGRQLHGAIVKKIYKSDIFVATSLVDMYAKCGEIEDSRNVFDGMRNRNTVTWTSIIAGYARKGLSEEAISLFRLMKRRNIHVNKLTIVSILRACGLIRCSLLGREIHAQIIKNSVRTNLYLGSTLVWFYCKCGEYSTATKVLQQMPLRDVVSWTAIISGGAHLGHESETIELLKEMMEDGVEPNAFTYSSALKACANLKTVMHGQLVHSSAYKSPAIFNVYVGSALIYMYAKCGYVTEASQVFDSMPERNLVSWKAMIVGYAKNGHCQEALKLMYRMQAEGFQLDDYILATVLTTCGDLEWDIDPSFECSLRSR